MKKYISKALFLALVIIPAISWGQYYFGQNKVQYTNFNWQVLTSDHFNVYFYPEEERIAKIAAKLAEDSYEFHVEKFNHIIKKKIPLIIYSSPTYFHQTNVIPQLLPEGVAGFTEYLKERVVVHYHGSYKDLADLIRHELTHVFQMNKTAYICKSHRKRNPARSPLWFTEGLAEHWSEGWSSEADMVIRDMVISGNIVPLDKMYTISGTFLMYKVGQSFLNFVAETYGDDKITILLENWWKEPTFNMLVEQTFGKPLAVIWKEWEYYLKKNYYPCLDDQHLPGYTAKRLTTKRYNVKPTVFSNITEGGKQDYIAFKTYRLGYTNIAVMSLSGEQEGMQRIIKGQRSARFESLHFIDSKIDVNNNGRLTFASKSHETDVLYIYDTQVKKIVDEYRFEGLININSPSWSPDSKKIVFGGTTMDGQTDIYYYDIQAEELKKLTDDIYYDQTPAFSSDSSIIVFSSDRSGSESMNIFSYYLSTGKIKQITFGEYKNLTPKMSFSSDRMLFTSDMNGVSNIYLLENPLSEKPRLVRLTDFATGVFDPVFTPNDSALVFCGYQDQSYNIYTMDLDSLIKADSAFEMSNQPMAIAWADTSNWEPNELSGDYIKGNVKYKTKFSFDIAQSAVSYDAINGTVGGLQGAFTDMLGNHQYYFLVYNTANTKNELINSFNVAVTYFNRQKRLNWGLGVYRFYHEYNDAHYGFVSEESYGGLGLLSYPFSRFDRVEASLYLRKYFKETLFGDDPDAVVATGMLSYIKDTSIWGSAGPIDGYRIHLNVSGSLNIKEANYYNSSIKTDIRKYFRLSESSTFAFRTMYFTSQGEDPQRYYLGGSWDLRGYSLRHFYGSNMFLVNNELRFPLLNRLHIGFPFGAIDFSAIRGAIFFDAGKAWDDKTGNLAGSFGFGWRVNLGYVTVLRFDFTRTTDFKHVKNGFDFDFFFGWNF
ncbi:MAG: PD40 domain-containing protein [candidate division Zixibacteria bacterium]|nr:PD40 domain-containing protein [candidate division Zixibacteria bacterium]